MPVMTVSQDNEQVLLDIVRILPSDRAEQLVDFARFLEAQLLSEELFGAEVKAEVEADNARWDALLDGDDAQALLNQLADEALVEHRAGRTKPMVFDRNGRIVPG
jgi:hypothetical protein